MSLIKRRRRLGLLAVRPTTQMRRRLRVLVVCRERGGAYARMGAHRRGGARCAANGYWLCRTSVHVATSTTAVDLVRSACSTYNVSIHTCSDVDHYYHGAVLHLG